MIRPNSPSEARVGLLLICVNSARLHAAYMKFPGTLRETTFMLGAFIGVWLGRTGRWRWLGLLFLADFFLTGMVGATVLVGGNDDLLWLIAAIPAVSGLGGYAVGALVERHASGAWPVDPAVVSRAAAYRIGDDAGSPYVVWDVETSLFTCSLFRLLAVVFVILFAFCFAIFLAISGGDAMQALAISCIGVGGVAGLILFVMAVILTGRITKRMTVTDEGYASEIVDRRLKWAVAASVVAGAAGRDPTAAGAGLIASSRSGDFHRWAECEQIEIDPPRLSVRVRMKRFFTDRIQATPETFDGVRTIVARRQSAAIAGGTSVAPA